MTDLIIRENTLPATMEDLSKFVLVGRDKLQAVRAEISAMQNLNLAKEVREQKLREGQEIGKLVLLAEARLGELFNQMPKDKGGRPKENSSLREEEFSVDEKPRPKLEVAADMGFNKNQVAQFQKLADNPDAVQQAIDYAEKNNTIATRTVALEKFPPQGNSLATNPKTKRGMKRSRRTYHNLQMKNSKEEIKNEVFTNCPCQSGRIITTDDKRLGEGRKNRARHYGRQEEVLFGRRPCRSFETQRQ